MLFIKCPWCGERAATEFIYGGDGTVRRPTDPHAVSDEAWVDYIYFRDNPRGPHVELWHHSAGCRRWIELERDSLTHNILATRDAGGLASEEGG